MLIVWIIASIMGILLDIACMKFVGICFTVGAYFALLAMVADYTVSAQVMIFLFTSICVYLITSPYIKKFKNNKKNKKKERI